MPKNRNNPSLTMDLEMLSGDINLRISQEINSLLRDEFPNTERDMFCNIRETDPSDAGICRGDIKHIARECLTNVQKTSKYGK